MSSNKVSIITVTYNSVDEIEKTIVSIIGLLNHDTEYIIIDGGSADGTTDIIKKYEKHITYWKSEPDLGIYDAMNKGIIVSTGEWVLFVNCGDILYTLPLNELLKAKEQDAAAFCGSITTEEDLIIKPLFSWKIKTHNTLPHQALFYNKEKMFSLFNLQYKVFADYDYNITMYLNRQKVILSSTIIAFHSMYGISNNSSYIKEFYSIIRCHYGLFFVFLSFFRFKMQGLKKRLIK